MIHVDSAVAATTLAVTIAGHDGDAALAINPLLGLFLERNPLMS